MHLTGRIRIRKNTTLTSLNEAFSLGFFVIIDREAFFFNSAKDKNVFNKVPILFEWEKFDIIEYLILSLLTIRSYDKQ